MFTGIITDLGNVRAIEPGADTRFVFNTGYDTDDIAIGASIACSGVCLPAVDKGPGWFAVEASAETLDRTTLGGWRVGSPVNFERALKLGGELGGHMMMGHVDDVAEIVSRIPEGGSLRYVFEVPEGLQRFIAPKGSIGLDGVSLTVNEVDGARFGVNIIDHTCGHTSFGNARIGDKVNLEVDVIARYLARLVDKEQA